MKKNLLLAFSFLLLSNQNALAQLPINSQLHIDLQKLDSLLFDRAFNFCELTYLEDLVAEDLEFFHDKSGIDNSKAAFIAKIKAGICSNSDRKPIRKLVTGSLETYPMNNGSKLYGAIQSGIHQFFIKEPGKELYLTSTAKFTHLWILEGEDWKLKKVLSFDHQVP